MKALGVSLVFGGLVMTALYAVLRRVGRSWWLWARIGERCRRPAAHRVVVQRVFVRDHPIEEMIFFDHPSGRTRIVGAMRWKKENLQKP